MDKIEEILENTKIVKDIITEEALEKKEAKKEAEQKKQEKKDKRKEQLKEAQSKFKQIKTNINEELQEQVQKRIEELDTNTSAYLQDLIKQDLFGKPSNDCDIEVMGDEATTIIFEVEQDNIKLRAEIERLKTMSLFEFIKSKYL